jgi:hypothetical protein
MERGDLMVYVIAVRALGVARQLYRRSNLLLNERQIDSSP